MSRQPLMPLKDLTLQTGYELESIGLLLRERTACVEFDFELMWMRSIAHRLIALSTVVTAAHVPPSSQEHIDAHTTLLGHAPAEGQRPRSAVARARLKVQPGTS